MAVKFKTPHRSQLATFARDHELIRFFELLSANAGQDIPSELDLLFQLVQEASVDAGIANTKANEASASIDDVADSLGVDVSTAYAKAIEALGTVYQLSQSLGVDIGTAYSKAVEVNDSLQRIAQALEINVSAAYAKAVEASDSLNRIAQTLEVNASGPPFVFPRNFSIDYIDFDQQPDYFQKTARVAWNPTDDTLNVHHSDGVTQQVGQELYGRITNNTGSLIPNGSVLGINPLTNSYVLFIADGTLTPITIIGVTTQDIPNGAQGRVTVWGQVRDIDTTGTPFGEVWVAGDVLYVSPTIAGGFTITKPTAPNLSMPIAQVLFAHATLGRIAVRPTIEQQLFYGQFIKTSDQVPGAINTATAITWDSATIANGVSIDGGTPSRIVVANAGLYKFSAAFQLTSSSASVKNVWLWFRHNGVDVTSSALVTSLDSATAIRTPSRSQFFSLAAGDYIELMFASDSTAMTIDNIASTAFAPAAPAAILSVNQEQQ